MELIIYFSGVFFALLYAFIEAQHDYYVIMNDSGYNDYSKRWHLWGFFQNVLAFLPIFIGLIVWDLNNGLSLVVVMGFLFWQAHDLWIGIRLYGRPFYLGNRGLDRWLDQVFWGGFNLFIIRMVFVLCGTLEYFR